MKAETKTKTESSRLTWSLLVYLLLANGITWAGWIYSISIAGKEGFLLPTIENTSLLLRSGFESTQHRWVALVFSLAVFGPLLAAHAAVLIEQGRAGLASLWKRILKWRIPVRWYGWAALLALGLALIPALLAALFGMAPFDWRSMLAMIPAAGGLLLIQVFTSGLGEEPGWRGYLLPRLSERFNSENTIWLLGLIWAVWHYPFTAYNTLQAMVDVPPVGMAITVVLSLAGQTMSLIGMTYLYVWLYNQTGSVLLMILFHSLTNTVNSVVFASTAGPVTYLVALMPWAVVLFLQKVLGKEKFPGSLHSG